MSFLIGQDGVLYQKDLGEKTGEVATCDGGRQSCRWLELNLWAHRNRCPDEIV